MFGGLLDVEDALQGIVTGAAAGLGFAFLGGPLGGAAAGGLVNGLWSYFEADGWGAEAFDQGMQGLLIGAATGAIPGGFAAGWGGRTLLQTSTGALRGGLASGGATALAGFFQDPTKNPTPRPELIPVVNIGNGTG